MSQCRVVGVDGGGAVEEELFHEASVAAAAAALGFERREPGRAYDPRSGHLGPV